MKFRIHWQIHLNVKNEKKADKLLSILREKIDLEIMDLKYERHWRDPGIFEARFLMDYKEDYKFSEAVFETLLRVGRVSNSWHVYQPKETYLDSDSVMLYSFEGHSSSSNITGITWLTFVLELNTIYEYGWEH